MKCTIKLSRDLNPVDLLPDKILAYKKLGFIVSSDDKGQIVFSPRTLEKEVTLEEVFKMKWEFPLSLEYEKTIVLG